MKNPFKQLMNKTHPKDETNEYLSRALFPVLTASGGTQVGMAIMECGETPEDIWGVLIGIHMRKLTALERARVKQLVDELKTFDAALKGKN